MVLIFEYHGSHTMRCPDGTYKDTPGFGPLDWCVDGAGKKWQRLLHVFYSGASICSPLGRNAAWKAKNSLLNETKTKDGYVNLIACVLVAEEEDWRCMHTFLYVKIGLYIEIHWFQSFIY